jgi:hypothetical protein
MYVYFKIILRYYLLLVKTEKLAFHTPLSSMLPRMRLSNRVTIATAFYENFLIRFGRSCKINIPPLPARSSFQLLRRILCEMKLLRCISKLRR